MDAAKGTVVWPAVDPKAGRWLWGKRQDFLWLAGVGSMIFALVAVPLTLAVPITSALLVKMFLRLGAVCNYPHYAITYQLIYRERARARSSWNWLVWSTPVFIAATLYVAFFNPKLIGYINRAYLTWSAYHYAAQHFGIASMYQAREKRPLPANEKRALQVGFVAIAGYLILLLNMKNGLGAGAAFGAVMSENGFNLVLPQSFYPVAVVAFLVGITGFVLAELWHQKRTGHGLTIETWLLFATNILWFVVPYVHLPGADGPWIGSNTALWLAVALPFFHSAQYLAICGWRARTTGSIKPIFYFVTLMVLGLALFEGMTWSMWHVAKIEEVQAILLVPAMLNLHHFFLDGLMWKSKRKPAAAAGAAGAAAGAKPDEKAAA